MMASGQMWIAAVFLTSGLNAQLVNINASLTNIPTNQSTMHTEFLLSHNSIVMSNSDINALKRYTRLRVLDLSYNRIEILPSTAFHSLLHLEILNLRENRLHSLPDDLFKGLLKLKTLVLEDNPWNCSCPLVTLIKHLNDSGVSIGRQVTCKTPEKLAGKTVLDEESLCSIQNTSTAKTIKRVSTLTAPPTNSIHVNGSHEEFTTSGGTAGLSTRSNSWKFLLGVLVTTLSTSMLIVCAVKSPSWYKLLFNYRHHKLCEDADPNVINTGRYSNFSLDTEQTETSLQELDESTG